jgi:hypothetical protein
MNESIGSWTRRDFLRSSAAAASAAVSGTSGFARETSGQDFAAAQEGGRKELWTSLGELPWQHRPGPPKLVSTEKHDGYTLERLILDLNGKEPVPALLLIPDRRQMPAPGMLYIHWHAGMYGLGKEQLLQGVQAQPAYAPVCAEKGLVTLAIDSWCVGERQREADGRVGEEDAFKLMLWKARVLFGMMLFDEFRALDSIGVASFTMASSSGSNLAATEPLSTASSTTSFKELSCGSDNSRRYKYCTESNCSTAVVSIITQELSASG